MLSGSAQRFLDALHTATAASTAIKVDTRPTATIAEWRVECANLGLFEGLASQKSAATKFSNYRGKLLAAGRIDYSMEAGLAWILPEPVQPRTASSYVEQGSRAARIKPGYVFSIEEQEYACAGFVDHITLRGDTVELVVVRSRCTECCRPFECLATRTAIKTRKVTRRCWQHRNPGRRKHRYHSL
jgi:hypothetical protein